MKKKTARILFGAAAFALLFAGCGEEESAEAASKSAETKEEGAEEEEEEKETEASAEEAAAESEEEVEEEAEDAAVVGVLFPEGTEESLAADAEALQTALEAAGYDVRLQYAQSGGEDQSGQIRALAEEDAEALIIMPEDPYGLTEALSEADDKGIAVFSYDELIMDTDAVSYYVTFDKRRIGQMLGEAIVEGKELKKVREEGGSCTIEFFMGSPDDTDALFLYNGVMEILQEYLDDGTLVCRSQETSFDDTGILRWSSQAAERRMSEILEEFYAQEDGPDIVCTGFDQAAGGIREALEEAGIRPESGEWPLITGTGCELEAVNAITEGKQYCSVLTDRRTLAQKCAEMVSAYIEGEDPETNNYEQYDNGKMIIAAYTCEAQTINADNYELLIDNGYYTEEEIMTGVPAAETPGETEEEEAEEDEIEEEEPKDNDSSLIPRKDDDSESTTVKEKKSLL